MSASFWSGFEPATCMPDACFCEAIRDGFVRQPANTWSNLAFCVAGLWMGREWLARRGQGGFEALEGACFALAVFLVGVTSGVYHASLTFFGQFLDVQSMYLLVLAAFAVNVDALRPGAPRRFLAVYLALNVALGVLLVTVPVARRYAFGLVIGAVLVTEVLLRRRGLRDWSLRPLLAAALVQGTAFAIWIVDTKRLACDPTSLVQGHAIWHVLGAVAAFLLWRYYRGPAAEAGRLTTTP